MTDSGQSIDVGAFVFDAYGTCSTSIRWPPLEERTGARPRHRTLAGVARQATRILVAGMLMAPRLPRADFAAVTAQALEYAAGSARGRAWTRRALAAAGRVFGAGALSRRARRAARARAAAAVDPVQRHARRCSAAGAHGRIGRLVDGVLSVDAADIYKPSPRVYALAVDRMQLPPAQIGFVSSNCWDAIGAKAFGFTTFWINRPARRSTGTDPRRTPSSRRSTSFRRCWRAALTVRSRHGVTACIGRR